MPTRDVSKVSDLANHLWESANILRGPVDAAGFKTYIFPLLFVKRISDVYDEEYSTALDESGGDKQYAQFPEHHRFQIPEGCHWEDVRAATNNVGQVLQRAMREIEQIIPPSTASSATPNGQTKIAFPNAKRCCISSFTMTRSFSIVRMRM